MSEKSIQKIRVKELYVTEDGTQFLTKEEAEKHQLFLDSMEDMLEISIEMGLMVKRIPKCIWNEKKDFCPFLLDAGGDGFDMCSINSKILPKHHTESMIYPDKDCPLYKTPVLYIGGKGTADGTD